MITKNYIKMCEGAKRLQKLWKPKVGDYVWRKYTFFGEQMDEQFWDKDKMEEIIILTYASEVDGYFHATKDGETRIFDSHNEAHKKTCIYLPTQEQLFKIHADWFLREYKGKMQISEYLLRLCGFAEIAEESDYKYCSLKEMMLGYLYQEKYSKTWTGEKWVKAE